MTTLGASIAQVTGGERGHPFLSIAVGGLSSCPELVERASEGIPPVISKLRFRAGLPDFYRFPSVYLIGRVYSTIVTSNGADNYVHLDQWRDVARGLVSEAGFMPLDGLALDLHEEDVGAGAGRAFLHASLCPIGIVEGRGRIGAGSIQEAQFILNAGGNVGLIVNDTDYDSVVAFLNGKSSIIPEVLPPAYFGFLDLEPSDVIRGYNGIQKWLKEQTVLMSSKPFKRRDIPKQILTLIDYYALCYARCRPNDMEGYEKLEQQVQSLTNLK